jgi:acetate CoA/acetoacetate CoA-transferase alpha subunit
MNKRISLQDAVSKIKDGMTVMVGGFLSAGSPLDILEALSKTGVKNLTIISNDTAYQGIGNGNLIGNHKVSHLLATHIGTNPDTAAQMNAGELKVEFCPQGTLAERIRCGGCGLGGVLTTTGLGTVMEYEQDGKTPKQKVTVDGKTYILERPLHADVALIGATVADELGNCSYVGTSQNFNPLMATAADVVIVEAEKIVPAGTFKPEEIITPSLYVTYLYESTNKLQKVRE